MVSEPAGWRHSWRSPIHLPGSAGGRALDSIVAPVISDTGALSGPRQPVFFRHDIHAGQFKIQCQYCHYSVAVSPEPGIPSMQTCMGCHLVGSDSASKTEIAKVRKAWNEEAGRMGADSLHPPARALPAPAAHQGAGAERLCNVPRRRGPDAPGLQGQRSGQDGLRHHVPRGAKRVAGLHRAITERARRAFIPSSAQVRLRSG